MLIDQGFHLGGALVPAMKGMSTTLRCLLIATFPVPSQIIGRNQTVAVTTVTGLLSHDAHNFFSATSKISDGKRNLIISKFI